jgi:hypothetical protein
MDKHSIKIDEPTYQRLRTFQTKFETFNEAVSRLLDIHDGLMMMKNQIEGNPEYQAWKERKGKSEVERGDRIGDSVRKAEALRTEEP